MRFGGGSKEIWHVNVKALGKNAWSLLDVPSPQLIVRFIFPFFR